MVGYPLAGTHLGLVIEFRADTPSSSGDNSEEESGGKKNSVDVGGLGEMITSTQLDDLLNLLANQDLDSK